LKIIANVPKLMPGTVAVNPMATPLSKSFKNLIRFSSLIAKHEYYIRNMVNLHIA